MAYSAFVLSAACEALQLDTEDAGGRGCASAGAVRGRNSGLLRDSYRARGFIDALLRRSAPIGTATVRVTTTTGQEVRISERLDEEMASDFVAATIRALATRGQVVIVGRGGQAILRDQPGVLHVRVIARAEDRLRRTQESRAYGETRLQS